MSGLLSVECRRAPDGAQRPAPEAEARWIVDPRVPGPGLPPVGRSLFDHLLARGARGEVPFPFRALTDALDAELQAPSRQGGLTRVLIPRGRSLQRDAAGPEFFKYPRAVVGVDAGPAARPGTSGMLLKDRLYLGYHETAAVIEVISYNEAAGRFEFQVVKDYRPGGARRVVYANRDLCMACHQNGGPIFARPLWDETNGNPDIASRLRAERRDFYGIPVEPGVDVAYEVDNATDRANRLAGYQLLWREGCGGAGPASVTCRADLFILALQQRLSGGSTLDRASARYGRTMREHLPRRWRAEWPQGLRLPNPDIPNRVPLRPGPYEARGATRASTTLTPAVHARLAELVRQTDIPSALEPLSPRDPLEVWTAGAGESGLLDRLVMGLGGFLADADIRRLDDRLAARASTTSSRVTSVCATTTSLRDGGTTRLSFTCSAPSGAAAREIAGGFSMTGRLYMQQSRVLRGTIDSLSFAGIPETPSLAVEGGTVTRQGTQRSATITLRQQLAGGRPRRSNGHRVDSVTLRFPAGDHAAAAGDALLVTMDDFAVVEKAVDEMAAATASGELDALADKPFRRASVLQALDTRLGAAPLAWCCMDDEGMPAPVLEQDEREDARPQEAPADSRLQALQRYCGRCHETDERFPPNFLHGSEADVTARVAQCAERIFFRLGMWERPAAVRPKAPMPPLSALAVLNVSQEEWPDHPDLRLLEGYVAGILRDQQGRPPEVAELEARGYANLRPCLAPSRAREGGK